MWDRSRHQGLGRPFPCSCCGTPHLHLFSMLPVLGGGSRNYRNEATQEGSSSSASQHLGARFTVPCPLQSSLPDSLPHTGLRRPATISFSGAGRAPQSGLGSSGGGLQAEPQFPHSTWCDFPGSMAGVWREDTLSFLLFSPLCKSTPGCSCHMCSWVGAQSQQQSSNVFSGHKLVVFLITEL